MTSISYSRRLADLAEAEPDRPAITSGERTVTRAELVRWADSMARALLRAGVATGDLVTIALPSSIEWFVAAAGCWKIGAVPQPVSGRLPDRELRGIVDLADPPVVVATEAGELAGRRAITVVPVPDAADVLGEPLPDVVSPAWKAPTSGGSTGRPKLIVSGDRAEMDPDEGPSLLMRPGGCLVMPGPLYHNGPVVWTVGALLWGNHVVQLPRFDPEATLAAIEQHRADVVYLVPTMMKRIWALPEDVRERYDLSALRIVWHLAEPCPPWLKQAWIDWLGPDRIVELYAGTEGQMATVITGAQWLEHRGSVGRPIYGSLKVLDAEGDELPPGEEGEVWMRRGHDEPTYRYVGAEPRTRQDGWESLGDAGWLDEDGYLYLGDRMQDMILTGGANVYPAEVEAALLEHPGVRSAVVIGLPDEDKGNRVHAIVDTGGAPIDQSELRTFLSERLVTYKLPRTFEVVDGLLRDDAGKVRRAQLRADRMA
jgi:bile acid-coenzyme A ligase